MMGTGNRPMQLTPGNDPKVREIVDRLVRAVDPDKVVLFGSRARNTEAPGSDYDVLIIKGTPENRYRRLKPARLALWGVGVPVDLLWYTPEELDEWSEVKAHVATQAVSHGVVVYEKTAA
jgi:uncharacterized protein